MTYLLNSIRKGKERQDRRPFQRDIGEGDGHC